MALNPFFIQGTQTEQGLLQDLVNEQLRMYGVEVHYLPREYITSKSVIKEVIQSSFNNAYPIEAYVENFEGYNDNTTLLSKFGIQSTQEITLIVSKERYENFISPLVANTSNTKISSRPKEGDLIYFPLGDRLFEVKFVEHEDPFFQLGKNYVYQLKCELFEYENEVIDTSIQGIDTQVQDEGYITTLQLIGVGRTATAVASIIGSQASGYVNEIFLNDGGSGYTSPPIVTFSPSPTGQIGDIPTAQSFLKTSGGVTSVDRISLLNAGAGYVTPPTITITGGGGVGAAATASVITSGQGVIRFTITDGGVGYSTAPVVTVGGPPISSQPVTANVVTTVDDNFSYNVSEDFDSELTTFDNQEMTFDKNS